MTFDGCSARRFSRFSGNLYYSYNLCDRQRILTAAFILWSGGWVIHGDGDGWLGEDVVDWFCLAGILRSRALETPWLEGKIICNLSSQQI